MEFFQGICMSWIDQFEGLQRLDPAMLDILTSSSEVASFKKNKIIFGMGKAPEHLVLLVKGSIQVMRISEAGREIVLYRVNAGSSCVLTSACVLAYEDNSTRAIAETDIEAVLIPRKIFDELLGQSKEFRYFVLSAFTKRLTDLFQVIEKVAFRRIDYRLAQKLIELSQNSNKVKATHQKLASELGSVREVVSRQMAEFQRRGWILQHRGMVEIIDREVLERLVNP